MKEITRTLEEQKEEFKQRKLLATPISGLIAWLIAGISAIFFSPTVTVWVLFIATGSIVYLAMGVSKFTGEDIRQIIFLYSCASNFSIFDCHSIFSPRLYFITFNCRDFNGINVVAYDLDYRPLDRFVSFNIENAYRFSTLVFISRE